MSIYTRINKIIAFLDSPEYDTAFDIWSALAHPNNRVLDLEHKSNSKFEIDVDLKLFKHTGTSYTSCIRELKKEDYTTEEYFLTEDLAKRVYKALEGVALKKIETEYQEEENKERTRLKTEFLNSKIYGQSLSFIIGDSYV